MLAALHAELEAIGIDWRARNIVFHGWRHFYAARMADIEAADKVSRITGHKSRAVFEVYIDHITEAAIMDMGKAAAAGREGPPQRLLQTSYQVPQTSLSIDDGH
jgi:integrase